MYVKDNTARKTQGSETIPHRSRGQSRPSAVKPDPSRKREPKLMELRDLKKLIKENKRRQQETWFRNEIVTLSLQKLNIKLVFRLCPSIFKMHCTNLEN